MSKLNNWFIYTELSTNGCFDENDNIMNKKTTTFELSTGENIEYSSGIVSDDDVCYCSGFSSNLIYVSDHGAYHLVVMLIIMDLPISTVRPLPSGRGSSNRVFYLNKKIKN